MRALLLVLALALFGCTSARIAPNGDRELRITTSEDRGVVIDDLTEQGRPVVMVGPHVSIVLEEGATVRMADLDGPTVSAGLDRENGWVTWEGNFEVEVVRNDEVESRFRVRDATMVLGRFEGAEGWTDRE